MTNQNCIICEEKILLAQVSLFSTVNDIAKQITIAMRLQEIDKIVQSGQITDRQGVLKPEILCQDHIEKICDLCRHKKDETNDTLAIDEIGIACKPCMKELKTAITTALKKTALEIQFTDLQTFTDQDNDDIAH